MKVENHPGVYFQKTLKENLQCSGKTVVLIVVKYQYWYIIIYQVILLTYEKWAFAIKSSWMKHFQNQMSITVLDQVRSSLGHFLICSRPCTIIRYPRVALLPHFSIICLVFFLSGKGENFTTCNSSHPILKKWRQRNAFWTIFHHWRDLLYPETKRWLHEVS